MSEKLMRDILNILVRKKCYTNNEIVDAVDIAKEINLSLGYIHEELGKMEYLDLVKLYKFLDSTSAQVTPAGLLTYDEAGKD